MKIFSDIFEDVLAPELAKIELSLVAENKEKEETKQKENMKVKFEALTSSSMLDDYSNSDSADYRHGSARLHADGSRDFGDLYYIIPDLWKASIIQRISLFRPNTLKFNQS